MKRPRCCVLATFCFLAATCGGPAWAQNNALAWVNGLRAAGGLPRLREDEVLARTALDWARVLAAAGRISHRGADGTDALDRYRAHGGTEVRVGEIIGAGPGLAAIETGWERSQPHRALALRSSWTHGGAGTWPAGRGSEVSVVVFCQKLVDHLEITRGDRELLLSGRFTQKNASGALLLTGMDGRQPEEWNPGTRFFFFRLAAAGIPPYIRLGFVTPEGAFSLTNAFLLRSQPVTPR